MLAEATPIAVDNIYSLIYVVLLLAIGGGTISLVNGARLIRQQRKEGRKDRIGELEDWAHDLTTSRDFYMHQSQWRADLNGRLIFLINSRLGAEEVQKVLDAMPPEPHETDNRTTSNRKEES